MTGGESKKTGSGVKLLNGYTGSTQWKKARKIKENRFC
jgi:hypothetical protein